MVMEEEVKSLLKDIKSLEAKRDRVLEKMYGTSSDSIRALYQQEADDLEKVIIRRMEVLRNISND